MKEIANWFGLSNFNASNCWLDRWKKNRNVKRMTISDECGDVSVATVDSWIERLLEILEGYTSQDVLNLDESGVFWQALLDKGFGQSVKQCKGGKKCKHRLTVTFIFMLRGKVKRNLS